MRRSLIFGLIAALFAIVLIVAAWQPVAAGEYPNRACEIYTKIPEAGMLPLGAVVSFTMYDETGPVTRTGTIVCYYVAARLNFELMLMDPLAYVIDHADPQFAFAVKNLRELTVH